MNKYAIIVAGGKGLRMNNEKPKQFLEIEGDPILVHTVKRFQNLLNVRIILVLPEEFLESWKEIESNYFPDSKIEATVGGDTRSESVRAGLNLIDGTGLVAVHDAVRPFVSPTLIEESFNSAEEYGSGIAAVPLKDSLRKKQGEEHSEFRDREEYVVVQTPQTFQVSKLKEAYAKIEGSFSDDATVFEMAGNKVRLIQGEYSNIKITTPDDLK